MSRFQTLLPISTCATTSRPRADATDSANLDSAFTTPNKAAMAVRPGIRV